jgi:hypothetical protein
MERPMSRTGLPLRKFVILCHRWLGTVFCLLFLMWFLSGVVLMYWDYPLVGARERLEREKPLDPQSVRVSPVQAYAALGSSFTPDLVRMALLDGRPVYRFEIGGSQSMVYADDGAVQEEIPQDMSLRIASQWTGQPASAAKFEGMLTQPDQWTVSGEFRGLRPLWKHAWPDGEEVYVSEVTGEVVQYTTRESRIGAYFGAIPHWLYFTPLRRNGRLWNKVVVWSSGIGAVTSLLGLVVGIWISLPIMRIPYTGPKRWHAILGLIFGLITCTWVFSGMLSMEPFDWQSGPDGEAQEAALRGAEWSADAFAGKPPAQALVEAGRPIKELDLTFFAGKPVYLFDGEAAALFDPDRVAEVMAGVTETRVVREYEPYYVARNHGRPLPVLFVRLADGSMFYVDLKTARIVQSYSSRSRWSRWLYHGLHSIDLPWLYKHRPAWDLFVLTLLLGGAALSVTSVMIGWQFVVRKVR